MSNISRRGINVSAYLQDLNTLPSPEEHIDAFNPDDLQLWTNTTFFDFDMGGIAHDPTLDSPSSTREHKPNTTPAATIDPSLKDAGEFDNFLDEFKEFENFDYEPAAFVDFPAARGVDSQQPLSAAPTAATHHVLPPLPSSVPLTPLQTYPISDAASPAPTSTSPRGSKRKASVSVSVCSPDSGNLEDSSRQAAEEDKRRRNTAASARFRIKKKQKEQQLEKTAKEMTDRVQQLEARVQQLELENKWLKGLIVEKNGGKSGEEMLMPPSLLGGNKDGTILAARK